jgi:hypothetical protein
MYRAGVLTRRKDGNQVYYRVADTSMVEICRTVCNQIAGRMDEKKPLRRELLRLLPAPKKRVA